MGNSRVSFWHLLLALVIGNLFMSLFKIENRDEKKKTDSSWSCASRGRVSVRLALQMPFQLPFKSI